MAIRPIKPESISEARTIMPRVRERKRPVPQAQSDTSAPEPTEPEQVNDEPTFAVGYGKPPIATRFKRGRSGNPKGRPKAAMGLSTIVRDTLSQKVAVRTPSGEKRISRIEAALHKTVELAMKGNPRALAQLIKLYADAVPEAKSSAGEQVLTEDLTATDLAILDELGLILLAGKEQAE